MKQILNRERLKGSDPKRPVLKLMFQAINLHYSQVLGCRNCKKVVDSNQVQCNVQRKQFKAVSSQLLCFVLSLQHFFHAKKTSSLPKTSLLFFFFQWFHQLWLDEKRTMLILENAKTLKSLFSFHLSTSKDKFFLKYS